MRKTTIWIMLPALVLVANVAPLEAQEWAEKEVAANRAIRRAREEALERHPSTIFIDSKTFDRKLRKMMKAGTKTLAVDFVEKPSPNDLPERLDAWLDAVERYGGTVEIKPSEPTRGLANALVYLARIAIRAAKKSSLYRVTKDYDATLYYSPRSGLVERVVFSHRSGSRQDNASTSTGEEYWFISPEEASELTLSEEEWRRTVSGTRGPSLGPRVSVLEPAVEDRLQGPTIETSSPLSLQVRFEKNRTPVDMDSLKISARRKSFPPISVSLTERIRAYIDGWEIAVTGIKIPRGKYLIELVIADEEGYETVETFRLQIVSRPR